jgi:PIN domain nuclease of toxin-antitoxin system
MDYLVDTHALLWHLFAPRRLGMAAQAALAAVDAGAARALILAVVVAEMSMVVERGQLPGVTVAQLLAQFSTIKAVVNYALLPLSPDTVIASHTLTAIPDIFDRLVVAEAAQLDLPLILRDPAIVASGYVRLVWDR